MGLFKANEGNSSQTLDRAFPPGTPFRLMGGQIMGTAEGSFGERLVAKVWVTPVTEPDSEPLPFGVWGSLAEQLTEVEPGELPAIVTLSDRTGTWRFEPHGPAPVADPQTGAEQPQRVNVEAHLDLDQAPTDSTLGAVAERPAPPAPAVDEGGHANPAPGDKSPSVHPTGIDESQVFQPGSSI